MAIQTKISRARFVVSPFSPEQMAGIGDVVVGSIKARLSKGLDVRDQPAPPLKKGYAIQKTKKLRKRAVRDWHNSGDTLGAMGTLSANENRAVVGFATPEANMVAAINNAKIRQFGLSPMDSSDLSRAVANVHPVKAEKVTQEVPGWLGQMWNNRVA